MEFNVFLPDVHLSCADHTTLSTVFRFLELTQPEVITQIGDLLDCYQLSSFDKNPARALQLMDEVELARKFWATIRNLCPNARLVMLEGNHEDRLNRLICRNPAFYGITSFSWADILDLQKYNVEWKPYRSRVMYRDCLIVTHGSRVGKYGGMLELESRGISGVSGHTHRLRAYHKTTEAGTVSWFEAGYLGSIKSTDYDYLHYQPDWQQGFVAGWYSQEMKRYQLHAVEIHNHMFLWNGTTFIPPETFYGYRPEKYTILSQKGN